MDNNDTITIPRAEYDELKKARFIVDVIGKTLTKYGVDDRVAAPMLRAFGYTFREEDDAE